MTRVAVSGDAARFSLYERHRKCESGTAQAAEGAAGFYLLGSKTSMASFIPPPGTHLSDYFYSGSTNAELEFARLILSGGVDADAYYNLPVATWIAPGKIWGGNVALTAMAPIGGEDVEAGATVNGPAGGTLSGRIQDEETAFVDPLLGAAIGWHEGKWHYNNSSCTHVRAQARGRA